MWHVDRLKHLYSLTFLILESMGQRSELARTSDGLGEPRATSREPQDDDIS